MAKSSKKREGQVQRETRETRIKLELNLDGKGMSQADTSVPFLDHMLELFSKHGFFDLQVTARGDTAVDDHHTVEDVGICLGQAFSEAIGDKSGIRRFGTATVPLDEALASVTVDISGRPFLVMKAKLGARRVGSFDPDLVHDFFHGFVSMANVTLHVNVPYGRNVHHKIECIFKAFGRALAEAVARDPRQTGVPSTKGVL